MINTFYIKIKYLSTHPHSINIICIMQSKQYMAITIEQNIFLAIDKPFIKFMELQLSFNDHI